MATTAKGTPYVESSDLVANYPAVSLALAEHIDDNTGKVLQVVRATDSTDRSTTSITFVDASISVTITPKESTSQVLVIWTAFLAPFSAEIMRLQLTDSSNVALSGAQSVSFGNSTANTWRTGSNIIGRIVPGVTTAVTYKGRFLSAGGGSCSLFNATNTGQIYAIEVSA